MAANLPLAVYPLSDFPDWVGPMWVKELRQGLRRNLFLINFLLLHVMMCGWVVFMIVGEEELVGNIGEAFFWVILAVGLLVIPGRSLQVISSERKEQTFELIQLSSLSPWQIVFGKWCALMSQALLLTVSLLPYACIRYFFGDFHLVYDSLTVAIMLGLAAVFTACGILVSTLNKYGVVLLILVCVTVGLTLLPFIIFGVFSLIQFLRANGVVIMVGVFPFYAVLYSLMILNFVALPMSGPLENNAARMKLLGWLMLVPPLAVAFFSDGWELSLVPAGCGVLGVIVTIFYSLGASPVPRHQAWAVAQRQGFWGRKTAWLLAPSSESGIRNALALGLMLIVSFLLPVWVSWTQFPAPLACLWFFICFFAGILLPWVPLHLMRRRLGSQNFLGLWLLVEIVLIAYTVGLAGLISNGGGAWLRVAACATPFGSLLLAVESKAILPESAAFIVCQWISIALVFWFRRPPKIDIPTLPQPGGAI